MGRSFNGKPTVAAVSPSPKRDDDDDEPRPITKKRKRRFKLDDDEDIMTINDDSAVISTPLKDLPKSTAAVPSVSDESETDDVPSLEQERDTNGAGTPVAKKPRRKKTLVGKLGTSKTDDVPSSEQERDDQDLESASLTNGDTKTIVTKKPRRKKTLVGQLAPFNKPSKFDPTADEPVDLTSHGRPKRQRVAATVFDPSAPELKKKSKRRHSLCLGKEENSPLSGLCVKEERPIKVSHRRSKSRCSSATAFEPTMPTIYEIEQKIVSVSSAKNSSMKVVDKKLSVRGRRKTSKSKHTLKLKSYARMKKMIAMQQKKMIAMQQKKMQPNNRVNKICDQKAGCVSLPLKSPSRKRARLSISATRRVITNSLLRFQIENECGKIGRKLAETSASEEKKLFFDSF